MLIPVQARINGQLGERLDDGLGAAALSFLGGLLVLSVLVLLPGIRQGLRRLVAALRGGELPRWYLVAGALGATLVLAQATTAQVTGVAVFTVAVIAGQTASGLVVDAVGFAGGVRRRPDRRRAVGAALVLVAAVVAAAPQGSGGPGPGPAVQLALAPQVAGFLTGFQQAMNGAAGRVAGSPLAATWVSFLVGAAVLALVWAGRALLTGTGPPPLPGTWWLYLGGPLGLVFVALAVVLVQRIGLLLLTMGSVAGQLLGSVVVDLVVPASGGGLSPWSVVGAAVTLVAVVVTSRRRA